MPWQWPLGMDSGLRRHPGFKEVLVRTTVSLDTISQLVEGRHENPFELLGPHIVDQSGRQAMAVRAFLPTSPSAWVVDPAHADRALPMQRIHPAGLFEAICPLPSSDTSPRYMLRVAEENG